jgi:hypothetical protein
VHECSFPLRVVRGKGPILEHTDTFEQRPLSKYAISVASTTRVGRKTKNLFMSTDTSTSNGNEKVISGYERVPVRFKLRIRAVQMLPAESLFSIIAPRHNSMGEGHFHSLLLPVPLFHHKHPHLSILIHTGCFCTKKEEDIEQQLPATSDLPPFGSY